MADSWAHRDASAIDEHTVSQVGGARERQHLIETYRKKARHYDITSRFYPAPGYPQRAHRLRAVQALGLRPGDRVVDIACGTGLNFPLIEQASVPTATSSVSTSPTQCSLKPSIDETNGWSNVSLVQADAASFDFPTRVDAILSTYALCQVPECAQVIAQGAAALSHGGRWVVLDLKLPDNTPRWPAQLGVAIVRHFASIDEWIMRRPWEAIAQRCGKNWPMSPGRAGPRDGIPCCRVPRPWNGPQHDHPRPLNEGPGQNLRRRHLSAAVMRDSYAYGRGGALRGSSDRRCPLDAARDL